MSMQSSIVYGYGFQATCIADERLRSFILAHAATIRENHDDYADDLLDFAANDFSASVEDAFCDLECEESQQQGALAIVSNTMSEETGIGFEYQPGQSDCDSEPTILLTSALPWMFNDAEKALNLERANTIMSAYMAELGIPGEPADISAEYLD